jgi:hypothetical protein
MTPILSCLDNVIFSFKLAKQFSGSVLSNRFELTLIASNIEMTKGIIKHSK